MTITVSCPACSTSYPVDPAKIPAGGVRAQCSACPEVFDVDKPDEVGAESTFAEPTEAFAEPTAPVESDKIEVPPEVRSPFGADAEVVTGITEETSDEFGGREFAFDSVETDEGLAVDTGLEVESSEEGVAEIELEAPTVEEIPEVAAELEEAPGQQDKAEEEAAEEEVAEREAPAAAATEEAAPSAGPIQFGKRSPEDKARSLARSLVSDLIAYNPDKHTEALAAGTLVQVFSDEIEKSWKEYREQVDPDVKTQGTFFNDALNELLANGEHVFDLEG